MILYKKVLGKKVLQQVKMHDSQWKKSPGPIYNRRFSGDSYLNTPGYIKYGKSPFYENFSYYLRI